MKIGNVETINNIFLAPMAGFTDQPFRRLAKEFGAGFCYTEMVSAKAVVYGDKKTEQLYNIHESEYPIGLQIFGSEPEIMAKAVEILNDKSNLIDINMGCPAPKIVKNGDGSALMKEPELIKRILDAVIKVAKVPITIKIRKGFDDENVNAVEIAKIAQEMGVSAITVHGRTRQEFYSGRVDLDIIKAVKDNVSIPVIGNGDVNSVESAKYMFDYTGVDAIMIGRGAIGNPWLFDRINRDLVSGEIVETPTISERVDLAIRHLNMAIEYLGEYVGIREMRKQLSFYIKGIEGGARVRDALNKAEKREELVEILTGLKE